MRKLIARCEIPEPRPTRARVSPAARLIEGLIQLSPFDAKRLFDEALRQERTVPKAAARLGVSLRAFQGWRARVAGLSVTK